MTKPSIAALGPAATAGTGHHAPVSEILTVEKAQRMAEFFGVLGDPNRWRILSALAMGEKRVGDLAAMVAMSESAVSHQLRILRTMRLVSYRKRGRNVFYCLKDDHIFNLYHEASAHLDEPVDEGDSPAPVIDHPSVQPPTASTETVS